MCAHYESTHDRVKLRQQFGVDLPSELARRDVWPGYLSTFVRRHPQANVGDEAVPAREAQVGSFGLVPAWSRDTKIARHTYNARSETVAEKPSFRDAWRRAQHCIVPVDAFFEPDWRSGKAVPTRIGRASGQPLGAAGLWSRWQDAKGQELFSFTLLTVNADAHPFMRQFHKADDEKRMIVLLPPEQYPAWLQADAAQSSAFLAIQPPEDLVSTAPQAEAAEQDSRGRSGDLFASS
jgi:putative SOS response-associated peptidase YedK